MEEVVADIKTRIPEFAGYADEWTRRLADEQIRAIVGEGLALLHDKHADYFAGETAEMYDRLILRCEFTNQEVFKKFEYESLGEEQKAEIARADAALIDKGLEAESVTADALPAYLRDLEAAFDARDAALTNK